MIAIPLDSVRNIRDLGGTPAADGRAVRPGCLIRSAHLGNATDEDLRTLRLEHRLDTVIDLRTRAEREEKPDRAGGFACLALPVIDDLRAGITHEKETENEEFPDMEMLYRMMVTREDNRAGFARALRAIFSHDYRKGSVLWHCSEGKDRCGMVTALALEALGVERRFIMADYLLTNRTGLVRARAVYQRLLPLRGEKFAGSVYRAYIVDERYLQAAWDAMGEDYLTAGLGLEPEEIARFREQVLA